MTDPFSSSQAPGALAAPRIKPAQAPSPGDIGVLIDHLSRALHEASFSDSLTPAQWNALRYLDRANATACTVTAFAHYHRTKKSTACQTMNALIEKQLVAKETDSRDSRIKRLMLTELGTSILRRDPIRTLARAVDGLPENELRGIIRALELMLRTLLKGGAGGGWEN